MRCLCLPTARLGATPLLPLAVIPHLVMVVHAAVVLIAAGVVIGAGSAHADGAMTLVEGPAGPYTVTVRVSPAQLRVGSSEWSVLVRNGPRGSPCLDCRVWIELKPTAEHATHAHHAPVGTGGQEAERSASRNRVLYSTSIALVAEGAGSAHVHVQGPSGPGRLDFGVTVAPRSPLFVRHGWALAWPAIALALFGLHQVRTRRAEPRHRSTGVRGSGR